MSEEKKSKAGSYKRLIMPCTCMTTAVWRPNPPHGRGSFRPQGRLQYSDRSATLDQIRENPVLWSSDDTIWSARIFIGFNVGESEKYGMDYLVQLFRTLRMKQKSLDEEKHPKPDSTFFYTRGIYTHEDSGKVITEDGGQIVVLNLDPNENPDLFMKNILHAADIIREELEQKEVIVEFQRGGIPVKTYGLQAIGTMVDALELPK